MAGHDIESESLEILLPINNIMKPLRLSLIAWSLTIGTKLLHIHPGAH